MNGCEYNGTDIFMRWEMECSIQRGKAELKRTFHLLPNENSGTITRMKGIHYLFYITSIQIFVIHWEKMYPPSHGRKAFIILIFVLDNIKSKFL